MRILEAPRKRKVSHESEADKKNIVVGARTRDFNNSQECSDRYRQNQLHGSASVADTFREETKASIKASTCHANFEQLENNNKNKRYNKPTALQKAVDLLARREHGATELERKLVTKGYSSAEIDIAIKHLKSSSLLSDDRFCESYVRMRFKKNIGPAKVRAELAQKGVEIELVESHIDRYADEWAGSALELYTRKYGNTQPENFQQWSKRARFLQSRGFDSTTIRHVCPDVDR